MKINIKAVSIGVMIALLLLFVKNAYSHTMSKQLDAGMARLIEEGGTENLYIGSSMFRQGINVDVLNEDTENSFVLSYNGNQPAGELLQLEYLMENGCRVEHVYVDMYAYSVMEEPWLDDNRLLFDSDLGFKAEYLKLIMENENAGFGTVWEMFVTANNEQFMFWPIHRILTADRYHNGGSSSWVSGVTKEDLESRKTPYVENTQIASAQREAIIDMVALCKKYDMEITFVETPKYQSVCEDEKYLSIMNEYVSLMEELEVEYILHSDTADYIDAKKTDYGIYYTFDNENANYYQDLIHLSTEGSKVFSNALQKVKE